MLGAGDGDFLTTGLAFGDAFGLGVGDGVGVGVGVGDGDGEGEGLGLGEGEGDGDGEGTGELFGPPLVDASNALIEPEPSGDRPVEASIPGSSGY